jgi:hypothetical protein
MVVGLPGTGIGGLFYIFLAFLMPVREAFFMVTGKGRSLLRWSNIAYQTVNATGIMAGLWGLSWLLGLAARGARSLMRENLAAGGSDFVRATQQVSGVVSASSAYLALVTLTGVILAVEVISILTRVRTPAGWSLRARANAPSAD